MPTVADVFVGRTNNLTFIRLVAALAVIYGHTSAVIPGSRADWVARTTGYAFAGGVAVDIFFLISGFLVTASLLTGGVRHYVASRVLRIYPALWVHLILVTFVLGPAVTRLPVGDYLGHRQTWSYFLGLATTTAGAFYLPGVFAGNPEHAVNGAIWSVLIEVWLYGCLLIFYFLSVFRSRAAFNVVFFVLAVALWQHPEWVPSIFAGTTNLHVVFMFSLGSFVYMNRATVPASPYLLFVALVLAGITLGTDRFSYAYVLVLVSFFCCASFSAQMAWLDRFGDYSYGVYLYGWPCQQMVSMTLPGLRPSEHMIVSMAAALVMGALSWHVIEKRALSLKSWPRAGAVAPRLQPSVQTVA